VIQLPSAPIEAGHIINIRFSIYIATDRVRLSFFLKNRINRVLELELEQTNNDCTRDARYIPVSEKYRGIESDGIVYRGLAKYRGIPVAPN